MTTVVMIGIAGTVQFVAVVNLLSLAFVLSSWVNITLARAIAVGAFMSASTLVSRMSPSTREPPKSNFLSPAGWRAKTIWSIRWLATSLPHDGVMSLGLSRADSEKDACRSLSVSLLVLSYVTLFFVIALTAAFASHCVQRVSLTLGLWVGRRV